MLILVKWEKNVANSYTQYSEETQYNAGFCVVKQFQGGMEGVIFYLMFGCPTT
jgi:hypothetical protein